MRITLLGLGIIGSVWARHWRANKHALTTWNRTPKPEAPGFEGDLIAAVAKADLVAIAVSDPAAVRGLLGRIAPHLRPGATVAQHSTVGMSDTIEFAKTVREAKASYLDMPFTGSKPAAEARQVVFYVGDDDQSLARVQAAYQPISKALLPIGAVGAATAMKLVMNLNIANVYQGLVESFRLAAAAGIAPAAYFRALELNVAKSGVSELKKDRLIAADYATQFAVKHMHKDLRLALALAAERKLPLPQTTLLEKAYAKAETMGLADADFSALAEMVKIKTGTPAASAFRGKS
jgi:3-hydroxyisobutyrate dehydrogenase-like beta-hydroxyacid dehydrogenase